MINVTVKCIIQCMLWFNFILGSIFMFLCFCVWQCMIMSIKQRKIKIRPRIKLNHNIYGIPANFFHVKLNARDFCLHITWISERCPMISETLPKNSPRFFYCFQLHCRRFPKRLWLFWNVTDSFWRCFDSFLTLTKMLNRHSQHQVSFYLTIFFFFWKQIACWRMSKKK